MKQFQQDPIVPRRRGEDATTGKILWTFDASKVQNAGGANVSPSIYVVNGREYVVYGFGGNPGDSPVLGDAVIAVALPEECFRGAVTNDPRPDGLSRFRSYRDPLLRGRSHAERIAIVRTILAGEVCGRGFHRGNYSSTEGC